ncbi:MAG TPA: PAAR-like domain-containing protein [Planctomycetota bacterium]|nr:PAAR-like domain-containing protein [Planctomycetota bacterium]
MVPASTKGGGMTATTGPLDVCKVPAPPAPPVPTPFPNMSSVSNAGGTASKTKFDGSAVVTLKSEMSSSNGDEAGVLGGMVSNRNMDKVSFKNGSSKVIVEGEKCVHIGSMTGHNGSNANVPAGAQVAPSQVKVLVGM